MKIKNLKKKQQTAKAMNHQMYDWDGFNPTVHGVWPCQAVSKKGGVMPALTIVQAITWVMLSDEGHPIEIPRG